MKKIILVMLLLELSASGCKIQSQRSNYAASDSSPFRAIHLPVGTHPDIVSIADVNKDGNIDILVRMAAAATSRSTSEMVKAASHKPTVHHSQRDRIPRTLPPAISMATA